MKRTNRRIPALLLAAAMMLTLFPMTSLAADGTITESGTYNLSDYGNDSAVAINAGLAVTLAGDAATTYTNVRIVCGEGVSLTLNNVNINNYDFDNSCALSFTGAGNALTLAGSNMLRSGTYQPGVKVEGTTELTIQGSGSIEASGHGAAGIGGSDGRSCGIITIYSGTVTAKGHSQGAGIGGGRVGIGGKITIEDGTVTATGGANAAGIGGGDGSSGGEITINGGTVTATGGSSAAGIGGGARGSNGGTITISGGTVTATGGGYGAGIGGGRQGNGGTIAISGGRVTATGGTNSGSGAGIGGGGGTSSTAAGSGGDITISGGTVKANGGSNAAGIGGGSRYEGVGGSGGTVTISGGSIYAIGNGGAANIGGGAGATDNGTLKNEGGNDVYLTTIQLLGSGAGEAAVSSLTTDLTYEYGVNDVFSDNLGWLYLYLPLGTETTEVITSAGTFTGGAVTAASPTAFYFAAGGADGREIELRNDGAAIQWRYADEEEWNDLVSLAALTGAAGADGREIELRVDGGYIQWRYAGDDGWNNIVALAAITGPQGPQGVKGATGANGRDGRDGSDGADGRDGQDGAAGRDGADGKDGNGITSITKTATDGNVDTYAIAFTDGTSATFTVTNGKDGVGVASATFNESGELVFTLTDGTQINLGLLPGSSIPTSGGAPRERDGTGAAVPIALGAATVSLVSLLGWLIPLLRRRRVKR